MCFMNFANEWNMIREKQEDKLKEEICCEEVETKSSSHQEFFLGKAAIHDGVLIIKTLVRLVELFPCVIKVLKK